MSILARSKRFLAPLAVAAVAFVLMGLLQDGLLGEIWPDYTVGWAVFLLWFVPGCVRAFRVGDDPPDRRRCPFARLCLRTATGLLLLIVCVAAAFAWHGLDDPRGFRPYVQWLPTSLAVFLLAALALALAALVQLIRRKSNARSALLFAGGTLLALASCAVGAVEVLIIFLEIR